MNSKPITLKVDETGWISKDSEHKLRDSIKEHLGSTVVLSILTLEDQRTLPQNNLFHKYLRIISAHTGYTKSETEEMLQTKFLTPIVIQDESLGMLEVYPSSSSLSKNEMIDLLEQIQIFAAVEFDIVL